MQHTKIRKLFFLIDAFYIKLKLRKPSFFGKKRLSRMTEEIKKLGPEKILDLGSGPHPRNNFNGKEVWGIDIRSYEENINVLKCDLSKEKIPFEDNSFDLITAYDLIEHIPRYVGGENNHFPFINLMNEVWRCLKVGGLFFSSTPCYPYPQAFQDPTHLNICTEDTMSNYFGEPSWARIYGFHGSFKVLDEGWNESHFLCVLRKTSDKEMLNLNFMQKDLLKND